MQRSEFSSRFNERVGSGELFRCSAHELIHTVLQDLKDASGRGQLDLHFLSGLDIIDGCGNPPHEPYQENEFYKPKHWMVLKTYMSGHWRSFLGV
jgi:hypothetical protein